MKAYYTIGTVGDAYVILCKLYSVAIREKILCKHSTKHKVAWSGIKQVFGLLPNIKVEFLNERLPRLCIRGDFRSKGWEEEKRIYGYESTYYPEFSLPNISYLKLPENYIAIQPIAGCREDRKLKLNDINKIIKGSSLIPIFVGEHRLEIDIPGILNFSGQTSIKEDVSIIKGSQHFYGPQGLLSFIAMSQKIYSTIYTRSAGWKLATFRARVEVEEWNKFLTRKNI